MSDLIDRQSAIDAVLSIYKVKLSDGDAVVRMSAVNHVLRGLPSAQPEIIRCKECKYGVQDEDERWYCRGFGCQVGEEDGSGFCSDAERKNNV